MSMADLHFARPHIAFNVSESNLKTWLETNESSLSISSKEEMTTNFLSGFLINDIVTALYNCSLEHSL